MAKLKLLKSLLALGAALGLILLFLSSLTLVAAQPAGLPAEAGPPEVALPGFSPARQEVITSPTTRPERSHVQVSESGPHPLPEWVEALMEGGDLRPASHPIAINKRASTLIDPANGLLVENGEFITYTVTVTNGGATPISLVVLDVLPVDNQGNLQLQNDITFISGCTAPDTCDTLVETTVYTADTSGGTPTSVSVERTTRVTWTVTSLAPGAARTLVFRGTVYCQPNGAVIRNQVFFIPVGETGGGNSKTETTVQTRINESGRAAMTSGPTGCSNPVETANRVSVADFDADGDLDMALGSLTGVTAFRNNGKGQFTPITVNNIQSEDVLWADFNNDGLPELLSVGIWEFRSTPLPDGGNYPFVGYNYIYRFNGTTFDLVQSGDLDYSFESNDGLIRVAAADYTGDGALDLATANFWGGCTLLLYKNRKTSVPFEEELDFGSGNLDCLLQSQLLRSIAWGDYDNDGNQDLAVGFSNGALQVMENSGNAITTTNPVVILTGPTIPAIDLAWGDYDGDGDLDLAAAFSDGSVKVFPNNAGASFAAGIDILTPGSGGAAVDWADFNGDGRLDLVAAASETRPRLFAGPSLTPLSFGPGIVNGGVFGVRGFDADNDGDIDLAVANQNGVSGLFTAFVPRLDTTLTSLPGSAPATSLAWGDIDNDDDLDLLLGSGSGEFGSQLYRNNQGAFPAPTILISGVGPQVVAVADPDDDGDLDAIITTFDEYQLHRNGGGNLVLDTALSPGSPASSLAWGDADDDGDLDLLIARPGSLALYLYDLGQLSLTPALTIPSNNTRSVAWHDFDGDFYLDFAAGNFGQPSQIYRNNGNGTFSLAATLPSAHNTTSIAWGDYDGDGQAELALGNEGEFNYIYKEASGAWNPVWVSDEAFNTSSLAWGDWNNDGDLDLAVGNRGQRDQVYENLLFELGTPQLAWRWSSDQPGRQTTGVAWGDMDRDGDLDLAISQEGGGNNGVYLNGYVRASHLVDNFASTMPLPNNPVYASIPRPGQTADAYFFSSGEILASSPAITRVNIPFTLFDPDGNRSAAVPNSPGDEILAEMIKYEYSLDNGGSWQPASGQVQADFNLEGVATRQGWPYLFRWQVQDDQAISENARFRITLSDHLGRLNSLGFVTRRAGLYQRGQISAISPPFRIRALTCAWPEDPVLEIESTPPYSPNVPIAFAASFYASNQVTVTWDFGDGETGIAQELDHIYVQNGTYTVVMTITTEPCPIARSLVVTESVVIGTGVPDLLTFLPQIAKNGSTTATAVEVPEVNEFRATTTPGAPGQVTSLNGTAPPGNPAHLSWQPNPAADNVSGYRVYRSAQGQTIFRRLAELPATVTSFSDREIRCGQVYFVTAYNAAGESLPSTNSYFTLPCH